MPLNRRDFLTVAGVAAGSAVVTSLLGKTLFSAPESRKRNQSGFLGNEVDFLGNQGALISFFDVVVREIDETAPKIHSAKKSWLNPEGLFIRSDIRYRDIPELVTSIGKTKNAAKFARLIESFQMHMLELSRALLLHAKNSKSVEIKNLLEDAAVRYFTISELFAGNQDDSEILKHFAEFRQVKTASDNPEIWARIETLLANCSLQSDTNIVSFHVPPAIRENLEETMKNSEKEGFVAYLEWAKKLIAKSDCDNGVELSKLLENALTVAYKSRELVKASNVSQANLLDVLIAKTESVILSKRFSLETVLKRKRTLVQRKLENGMESELKRNLETTIYTMLTEDIMLKDLAKEAAVKGMSDLRLRSTVSAFLVGIMRNQDGAPKKELYGLTEKLYDQKRPFDIDDCIRQIRSQPKIGTPAILEELEGFKRLFQTEKPEHLQELAKKRDFTAIRNLLERSKPEERRLLLFVICSHVGWHLNTATIGANMFKWKFDSESFELSRLKNSDSTYNCMSLSALGNYVLEELLWLHWYGANFFKHHGEFVPHQTNVLLTKNNETLMVDFTNDEYYFATVDRFDDRNTYQVDRFANTYMEAAYHTLYNNKIRDRLKMGLWQTAFESVTKDNEKILSYLQLIQKDQHSYLGTKNSSWKKRFL